MKLNGKEKIAGFIGEIKDERSSAPAKINWGLSFDLLFINHD
jgi:hypothetical protein